MSTPDSTTTPPSPTSAGWTLFTPRFVKHGKLLLEGVQKFIHYKRDILSPTQLAEIESLRDQYKAALAARDQIRLKELEHALTVTCDTAAPSSPDAGTRDWVESLVVCAVIVFAIRAYFLQPFKIPTGSMQPTLNGIIATRSDPDTPTPNILKQGAELVLRGRNHVRVEAPCDGYLEKIDSNFLRQLRLFLSVTRLHYIDTSGNRHTQIVWAPALQLVGQPDGMGAAIDSRTNGLWLDRSQVGNGSYITPPNRSGGDVTIEKPIPVKKGQVLAAGTVDSGDMVLVDKFSYHFRKPRRGEVFVFNTRNIADIERGLPPGEGSQHYIKRLTGVPGDRLSVKERSGPLWINGAPATEKYIRRVYEARVPLTESGYHGYDVGGMHQPPWGVPGPPREGFFAMGDNSFNSFDSRYWGPVPKENLVGPGLFALWPITTGHWGLIK